MAELDVDLSDAMKGGLSPVQAYRDLIWLTQCQ